MMARNFKEIKLKKERRKIYCN